MLVRILYFAALRERLGQSAESLDLRPEISSVGQLREHLAARGGEWVALTRTRNLRMAVNHVTVAPDTPLADGDEIAFFPPVTGG
jgi:molybdopterin synthase sulfur carrier subunit